MTEAEWLAGTRPLSLLGFLLDRGSRSRYPDRKFRLFACACVRQVQALLADRRSRQAVEVAERYALARTDRRALDQARNAARQAALSYWQSSQQTGHPLDDAARAAHAAIDVTDATGGHAAWQVCQSLAPTLLADTSPHICDLLRDVFGNPFRTPALPEHWRLWNEGAALRLARHIHAEGRHDELPILADALEDAGCTDAVILEHCRLAPVHTPGCWVLELLLAEEWA